MEENTMLAQKLQKTKISFNRYVASPTAIWAIELNQGLGSIRARVKFDQSLVVLAAGGTHHRNHT